MITPVKRFIVEIGDPYIDEAHCNCGEKLRSSERWRLNVWAHRHAADHIEKEHSNDTSTTA